MSNFESAYNKKHYEWHICVKNKLFWALFRVFISCFKHLQQKTKALLWVNFGNYLKVVKATAQWFFLFPFYFSNSLQQSVSLFLKQSVSLISFFWHDSPIWRNTVRNQQRVETDIYGSGLVKQLCAGFSCLQILIMN